MPLERNETLFNKVFKVLEKNSIKKERLGIRKNISNTRDTNFSIENGAFEALAVGQLVKWGYNINDILSKSFPETLLVKAGQRVMDNFDNDKGVISNDGSARELDFNNYAKELYFTLANSLTNEIDNKFSGKEIKINDVINGKYQNMLEMNTLLMSSINELSKEPFTSIFEDEESLDEINELKVKAGRINSRITPYEKVLENSLKLSGNVYSDKYDKIDSLTISDAVYDVLPYIAQINLDNQVVKRSPNTKISLNEFDSSFVNEKVSSEIEKYNRGMIEIEGPTIKEVLDLGVNENGESFIENIGRNLLDEEVTNKIISVDNKFDSYNISFNGISPLNKVDEVSSSYEHKKIKDYKELSTDEEIIKRASEVVDPKFFTNSAYGINGFPKNRTYPFNLHVDRSALISLSVGRLIMKGYTFQEIFSEEFQATREQAMSESIEMMNKYGESEEFKNYATEAYEAVLKKGIEYVENNFDPNVKIEDVLKKEEYKVLNTLSLCLIDAGQEVDLVNHEWKIKNNDLIDKEVRATSVLSNLNRVVKGAVTIYTSPKDQIVDNPLVEPSLLLQGIIKYKSLRDKAIDDPSYMPTKDVEYARFENEIHGIVEPYNGDFDFLEKYNPILLDEKKSKTFAMSLLSTESQEKIIGKEKGKYKISHVLQLANDKDNQKKWIKEDKYAEVNTSNVNIEDARKWFNSFKNVLKENGYPTNSIETALYLKAISTVRDDKDYQYAIAYEKHLLRKSNEELDAFNLIYGNKTIDLIGDDDIKELYKLSKEGNLTLTPKDGNVQMLKSLYVKDDGTCGISAPVNEILGVDNVVAANDFEGKVTQINGMSSSDIKDSVLKNRKLVKNIYNEAVRDKFPGLSNPFTPSDKLTFYIQSREGRSFSGLQDEKEIDELNIKENWESTILNDYNKHPEFYQANLAKTRGEHFKNSVYAQMSSDINIKNKYEKLAKENPAEFYDEMEDVVFDVANKFYGNLVLDADPVKNKSLMVKRFINEGHIKNALNENYRDKAKAYPWSILDNISKDLANGIEVVCDVKNGDNIFEHLITMDGEIKLKKNPVNTIDMVQKNGIIDYLKRTKELLINNGITKHDSDEFKNLMTNLDETITQLNGTISKTGFNEKLNILKRKANDYYFAKLDEPQNSRRKRRFEICDALRNMGDGKSAIDRVKERIASKALKTYYKVRLESNNEEIRDEATSILNSATKESFKNKVKQLMESQSFKYAYGNKTLEQLDKEFKKSPADVVNKALFTKVPKSNQANKNAPKKVVDKMEDKNVNEEKELFFS